MAFVPFTILETTFKKFLPQAFFRKMKDNFDDHESRIVQLFAQSRNGFVDDFLVGRDTGAGNTWIDGAFYDSAGGAANFLSMMESDGFHVVQAITVAVADTISLSPVKSRCRFRLNQDMVGFFEARKKDVGTTAPDNICIGLQDRGLTGPADETDCIAFFKGTAAGKWRFRVAKAGVASQTDDIGNRATWQKLRIEWTRSGGGATLQVKAFIDGAEIAGSPFTTNIPDSVVLKPFFGVVTPAAGNTDVRMDRWEVRWTAVPVNS